MLKSGRGLQLLPKFSNFVTSNHKIYYAVTKIELLSESASDSLQQIVNINNVNKDNK